MLCKNFICVTILTLEKQFKILCYGVKKEVELNKIVFFFVCFNPLRKSVSCKKNKKGIDPELNKIVSCGKKWGKMFHELHKVDMRVG